MTSILTRKLRGPQMLCRLSVRTSGICNNKHSVHLHSVKLTDVSEEHWRLIRVLRRPPREPLWIADVRFIHAECPSCHPTNSVRSLKANCDQKLAYSIGLLWPNSIATVCDHMCNRINLSTELRAYRVSFGNCYFRTLKTLRLVCWYIYARF